MIDDVDEHFVARKLTINADLFLSERPLMTQEIQVHCLRFKHTQNINFLQNIQQFGRLSFTGIFPNFLKRIFNFCLFKLN